jgi:hypothetical protein
MLYSFSVIQSKLLLDREDYPVVNCSNKSMKRTARQLEENVGRYAGGGSLMAPEILGRNQYMGIISEASL